MSKRTSEWEATGKFDYVGLLNELNSKIMKFLSLQRGCMDMKVIMFTVKVISIFMLIIKKSKYRYVRG